MTRFDSFCAVRWMVASVLLALPECASAADESPVVARVGGTNITLQQVNQQIARVPGHEKFSAEVVTRLQVETRQALVERELARQFLDREKYLPNEQPWEARWARYVADHVTDADTRQRFDAHRRDFDGTQLRVRHIVSLGAGSAPREEILRRLRVRIVSGEIGFEQAAREQSQGPSRDRGGDIGWIERRSPMVESFSRAAFALQPGEISEVVTTPFGVHLIQCVEEKPGRLRWEEVQHDIRARMSIELLTKLAKEMEASVPIEYVGDLK